MHGGEGNKTENGDKKAEEYDEKRGLEEDEGGMRTRRLD